MPKAFAARSPYPRICVRIIGGVHHWLPVKAVAKAPANRLRPFVEKELGYQPGRRA